MAASGLGRLLLLRAAAARGGPAGRLALRRGPSLHRTLAADAPAPLDPPPRPPARRGGPPAAAKWTRVRDKETGLTYWWNEETDQTTPVGVPRPTGDVYQEPGQTVSFGSTMVQYVGAGLGVSLAFMGVGFMGRAVFGG